MKKRTDLLKSFKRKILESDSTRFNELMLELFHFQAQENSVYRDYILANKRSIDRVSSLADVTFLPIEFFRTHQVKTSSWTETKKYTSSGTTSSQRSIHFIQDRKFYLELALKTFRSFLGQGSLSAKTLLALLPSYMENQGSSLIDMVGHFVQQGAPGSGFYRKGDEQFITQLNLKNQGEGTIIWGVTFALLDLAEKQAFDLSKAIIIETGGMKGRREEITREEFHEILRKQWNTKSVYSEYGMTELLSQAYGKDGNFRCSETMKVTLRELNDPFVSPAAGQIGGLNVVDLANVHSCAFVETKDLGRINTDGTFQVLGRFDNSDIRGCNLLLA